jgi:hypothetical protein
VLAVTVPAVPPQLQALVMQMRVPVVLVLDLVLVLVLVPVEAAAAVVGVEAHPPPRRMCSSGRWLCDCTPTASCPACFARQPLAPLQLCSSNDPQSRTTLGTLAACCFRSP